MLKSTALEINLRTSRREVVLDPKYDTLRRITAKYYGLLENLDVLLNEICHPLKNWAFVISETRRFALGNFYIFKDHPLGPHGVRLLIDVFLDGVDQGRTLGLKAESMDNLLAYLQLIISESGRGNRQFSGSAGLRFPAAHGLE